MDSFYDVKVMIYCREQPGSGTSRDDHKKQRAEFILYQDGR